MNPNNYLVGTIIDDKKVVYDDSTGQHVFIDLDKTSTKPKKQANESV